MNETGTRRRPARHSFVDPGQPRRGTAGFPTRLVESIPEQVVPRIGERDCVEAGTQLWSQRGLARLGDGV